MRAARLRLQGCSGPYKKVGACLVADLHSACRVNSLPLQPVSSPCRGSRSSPFYARFPDAHARQVRITSRARPSPDLRPASPALARLSRTAGRLRPCRSAITHDGHGAAQAYSCQNTFDALLCLEWGGSAVSHAPFGRPPLMHLATARLRSRNSTCHLRLRVATSASRARRESSAACCANLSTSGAGIPRPTEGDAGWG